MSFIELRILYFSFKKTNKKKSIKKGQFCKIKTFFTPTNNSFHHKFVIFFKLKFWQIITTVVKLIIFYNFNFFFLTHKSKFFVMKKVNLKNKCQLFVRQLQKISPQSAGCSVISLFDVTNQTSSIEIVSLIWPAGL